MKKILRCAVLGTTLGAIGLAACDAAPPPNAAVSQPVAPKAIPESETLVDVARAALAAAVRDQDPYSRARRLGTLLPTLGPDSVPAVTQTLDDLKVDLKATDLDLLVRFWATYQPEAASRWAIQKSPTNYRTVAVYSALSAWAEADPRAAVKVAWDWESIPNLGSIVPIALVRGWYAANPPELRRYLREIPPDILGQRAIAAYIRVEIETQGSEAAQRWAESLPDGKGGDHAFKLAVFRRVTDALAQLDDAAAMRWCEIHCSGPYGSNMRSLIAREWAIDDAPSALAWLSTAPPGPDRDFAVLLTFDAWGRRDRGAALEWMAAQTTGEPAPWLRAAYPTFARLLSGDAPLDAIKWAERIENAQERQNTLIGVLRVWRYYDEAAAENWLLQSSLSEEERETVRLPPEQVPGLPAPVQQPPQPNG